MTGCFRPKHRPPAFKLFSAVTMMINPWPTWAAIDKTQIPTPPRLDRHRQRRAVRDLLSHDRLNLNCLKMTPPSNIALGLPWVVTSVVVAFAVGTQCSPGAGGDGLVSFLNRSPWTRDLASDVAIPENTLLVNQRDSWVLDEVTTPGDTNLSTVSMTSRL